MPITLNGSTGITYPAGGVDNVSGSGVGTTDSQTLTNKTITSPVLSGTATGTYTLGGTPSMAASALTGTIDRARLPTGSVLQVQFNDFGTLGYTAVSSTNVDYTGFSASFTPLYASSKVLIILSAGVNYVCDGTTYLKRNGSIVKSNWFGSSRTDDTNDYPQATALYMDSPGTTSAVTYQIGGRATGCGLNIRFGSSSEGSTTMTFMEIAA